MTKTIERASLSKTRSRSQQRWVGQEGHYDNRTSGYRETWINGKVATRIHSSQILPGYPRWRTAWGTLPDMPNTKLSDAKSARHSDQ